MLVSSLLLSHGCHSIAGDTEAGSAARGGGRAGQPRLWLSARQELPHVVDKALPAPAGEIREHGAFTAQPLGIPFTNRGPTGDGGRR